MSRIQDVRIHHTECSRIKDTGSRNKVWDKRYGILEKENTRSRIQNISFLQEIGFKGIHDTDTGLRIQKKKVQKARNTVHRKQSTGHMTKDKDAGTMTLGMGQEIMTRHRTHV